MAKIKTPNQKKAYRELAKRLNRYTKRILAIYAVLANEAAKVAISAGYDGDKEFSFDNYPKTKRKVNSLLDFYAENMQTVVYSGITEEWENSNTFQDLLVRRVIKAYTKRIGDKRVKRYYEHNNSAKEAFKKRTINGMNLSQRIWNQREDVKKSLERALSTGIEKGMSAVNLSKRVSKYLNDYPSLAKDYKKKYGKAIDVSGCEYRSVRLARNEINMAYRSAEQERWTRMDYIKGKEIKTTNNINHKSDMCDLLSGIYPSDFYWTGWHVNCMCYAIPVIMSEEEFWAKERNNKQIGIPHNFTAWVDDNKQKIAKYKPTFYSQNKKYFNEKIKEENLMPGNNKQQKSEYERMDKKEAVAEIIKQTGCTAEKADFMYESIRDFSFGAYQDMRTVQMGGTDIWDLQHSVKEWKERVDACEEFITKSPKWNGGATYRGMHASEVYLNELYEKSENGTTINMNGISSWSTSKVVAEGYTYPNAKTPIRIIFETDDAQIGTSIAHISIHPNEKEILCSKDNEYFVSEIVKWKNNIGIDFYIVKLKNKMKLS